MATIIYSEKLTDREGSQITSEILKEVFKDAIRINKRLSSNHNRVAFFFIDPLLENFEAANNFYFGIMGCQSMEKINTYKSGAGPVQALFDAKELINHNLYDAVFIFGYEPLLKNKHFYGKDVIKQAMDIFNGRSILECYNLISHRMCEEMGISKELFFQLTDGLYRNYLKTYAKNLNEEVPYVRGRLLDDLNGDLFRITDCANPNIDFAGGIIIVNDKTADSLNIKNEKVKVSGVKYNMVEGIPGNIREIVGNQDGIFSHLRNAFLEAQHQAKINVIKEFRNSNLLLELYTCYPPIPLAFLLTTKMVGSIRELPQFLSSYEITITGGMNFARAPWNNPALNGLIEMCKTMNKGNVKYGLVHGNGGIGEVQGVAILERV
ncbi:hypothetical protein [Desulfosporosinus sp. Sb-LF]|uniref:hypothetical protein n=1 Tax=Desulfosporosinus sp. Sb-LF TaxID=2560027 RepID=UPI00107FC3BF|nr:hypothetical protein [Desulfosporosinus sp. Sb-LF]TGE33642.1 hypothetical protein E4K68_05750 [Desulfosporosinus sp. Sb-LF]